nr:hypothetical protein [Gordonia sp. LAM0048]
MATAPATSSAHTGPAAQVRIASIVGFLVVAELSSGLTQGWINPPAAQLHRAVQPGHRERQLDHVRSTARDGGPGAAAGETR